MREDGREKGGREREREKVESIRVLNSTINNAYRRSFSGRRRRRREHMQAI